MEEAAQPEVSVVIPCLNEADTIGICVSKAQEALTRHQIVGEVVVADNGSSDGSQEIANRLGAKIVPVSERGYGSALIGGINAARGKFVIMGDADDSYDFSELPKFVERLREGYDLVQGCRLPAGGGSVARGAMPLSHRWLGNPLFTSIARWWYGAPIHDVYCGFRGFRRDYYHTLNQRCTGMEFAIEMIVKASLFGARISEVPITLHPDGRVAHAPHLRTVRDGWRTLRFFLLYCPRWLFSVPGMILICLGLIGYIIAMPGLSIAGVTFDAHTLFFASLAILCGYQALVFGSLAQIFAVNEGFLPETEKFVRFYTVLNLERGLLVGFSALLFGLFFLVHAVYQWYMVNFGELDYSYTMRWVIPGATLTVLGFQTILSSFFGSILGLRRR